MTIGNGMVAGIGERFLFGLVSFETVFGWLGLVYGRAARIFMRRLMFEGAYSFRTTNHRTIEIVGPMEIQGNSTKRRQRNEFTHW